MHHGAQLAVDITLRSALTTAGLPSLEAASQRGGSPQSPGRQEDEVRGTETSATWWWWELSASVLLSRVLTEAGVRPAVPILAIRKIPGWHETESTQNNNGCGTCVVGCSRPLGATVQRRPNKYSGLDPELGPGRADSCQDSTGITPSGVRQEGHRASRREVCAQARDERLSTPSEPDVTER